MADLFQRIRSSKSTVIEAVVWLGLVIALWVLSSEFNEPLPTFEPGPAYYPRIVLAFTAIAALVMLIGALVYHQDGADKESEQVVAKLTGHRERVRMFFVFVLPVAYVYGMHKLGFLLITPFFLLTYMYVFGVRKLRTLLRVAGGVYVAIVIIFVKLIFTPLPQGVGIFYTINGHMLGFLQ